MPLLGFSNKGLIAMWSGLLSAIPSGFKICDGNEGRPNLLDKFLYGVPDAVTNPGTIGGAATHYHTTVSHLHSIAAHNHTVYNAVGTGMLATGSTARAHQTHNHPCQNSSQYNCDGATPNTDNQSNDPPYLEVAFLYPMY